jgi:hypothetical protein
LKSLWIVVLCLAGALASAPGAGAHHQPHHPPGDGGGGQQGRTGVLIVDHGEPPEYNADTYESFRAFIEHLLEMGVMPGFLASIDTGTVVQDADCYGCGAASPDRLIDAWLGEHAGPAVWTPSPVEGIAPYYTLPGGPGLREPDVFEHAGLQSWHEWEQMGGRSPNYDQKLAKKRWAIKRLKRRFGDKIAIAVGYGIDPRIDGAHQGIAQAIERLARKDVARLAVVYHGVGFSDLMQTHMIRHHIHESMADSGLDAPVTYAGPLGSSRPYIRSVVRKAQRELSALPARSAVAIHLSGHGLGTSMCGSYNCGADGYHAQSEALFERTKRAIEKRIDRPGPTGVFRLYGDGAESADDPQDLVDSPIEALDARAAAGFENVVDIPFEFDSDSRDTLIVLRQGYRRPIPDWNERYESEFSHAGMDVRITNASFGFKRKARALERVAVAAIEEARRDGSFRPGDSD